MELSGTKMNKTKEKHGVFWEGGGGIKDQEFIIG